MTAEKFFNTSGPIKREKNYSLDPLGRFDLPEILNLIDKERYFVLHAPRQTGKTSCLLALMELLNRDSQYTALYVNVESAQAAREKVADGMRSVLNCIANNASYYLKDDFVARNWERSADKDAGTALQECLSLWCQNLAKPLVLLIDEIDALVGDTLISILRQLRSGYTQRPAAFPQTVILCGVRDVRDYRIHSDVERSVITGGSAFNIKAESLRLGNFTFDEMKRLLGQHTQETGQKFESKCFDLFWQYTEGQPWLTNALAYEVTYKIIANRDRTRTITASDVENAKESIIMRRDTHIDQLVDKLKEKRVRDIIAPILAGEDEPELLPPDDVQYLIDLGLIVRDKSLKIANKIYSEVIPRELTFSTQYTISQEIEWYQDKNGRIDMAKLMPGFQEFFRRHSDSWIGKFDYKEAGPQLLLQAFLQRIVNGGGKVEREYGLGMKRTDLLVEMPYPGGKQTIVLELKILRSYEKTKEIGLKQTAVYMDISGADEGHLVIFDRDPKKDWDEKIYHDQGTFDGKTIDIWGM